jgi:hypothetical protein
VTAARGAGSRADRELITELEALGVVGVTARRLERYRQAGLIVSQRRRGAGRGGSVSRYQDGTAAFVGELDGVLGEVRSLPFAALTMFGRGRRIPIAGLRAAYLDVFEAVAPEPIGDKLDELSRAEEFVRRYRKVGRRSVLGAWRRRVRGMPGRAESTSDVAGSAFTSTVLAARTGTRLSFDQTREIVYAAGFGNAATDQDVRTVAAALPGFSVPMLRAAVATATVDDLEQARDEYARLVDPAMRARSPELPRPRMPEGLWVALQVPAWLVARRYLGLEDPAAAVSDWLVSMPPS